MSIKAGVAIRDITPQGSVKLFGYPGIERKSSGVNDPLLVSALHFRSGSKGVIIVSVDLLFLDPATSASVRRRVSDAVSMPEERLFIACTHNHSGPATGPVLCWKGDYTVPVPDEGYMDHVTNEIVAAASEAAATTTPVEIAWAGFERAYGNGQFVKNDMPDSGGAVLAVKQKNSSEFLAFLTIADVYPAMLNETSVVVSSDFVHYSRGFLKDEFGSQVVVVHLTGECADAEFPFVEGGGLDSAESAGHQFGESVKDAVRNLSDDVFTNEADWVGAFAQVEPVRRNLPGLWDAQVNWGDMRAEYERLQSEKAEEAVLRRARNAVAGAGGILYMVRAGQGGALDSMLQNYTMFTLHALRIGDRFLAGMPGILESEYEKRIREKTGGKALAVSFVNGDLQGYLPSKEAPANEASCMVSPFAAETGEKMAQAMMDLLVSLG